MKAQLPSIARKSAVALLSSILALGAALAPASAEAAPETRIALVIGNGAYANVPLKNPPNDARDLADDLRGLGFSVSLLVDGDFASMSKAIRDFGNAIRRPDAVALFYYSGHGVQYRGANYLIPARSDIQDPDELAFSAVNADQVYAKMESAGDRTNIVILDACRNNPFPGAERATERGLAIVGSAPPQSLIVYSTAPGKTAQDGTGRNGVFTKALLDHLAEPGLDVELMIRRVREDVIAATKGAQVPWNNSSISGAGFSFAAPAPAPAPEPRVAASATAAPIAFAAGKGLLNLTSDPPGMTLVVDGGDEVTTPASLELPAGAHSFEPKQTVIDQIYYAAQPLQWITVTAGVGLDIPVRIKPATATLEVKLAPPGFKVSVDGQELGETPMGPVEVKAGYFNVLFSKEGEPDVTIHAGASPGDVATASWGRSKATAFRLPRANIKLDGLPDSWNGIEPVYEVEKARSFMDDPKCGVKAVYLCRDEKYIYWRVDFAEVDPILKTPKGVGKTVDLQIDIWDEATRQDMSIATQYNSQSNRIEYMNGIYSDKTRQWNQAWDVSSSGKHSKNIFAGRIDFAWAQKHFYGVFNPKLTLVATDSNWKWMDSTKIVMDLGWVEFRE